MTTTPGNRKGVVLIAAIAVFVVVVGLIAVDMAWSEPVPSDALGANWQCSHYAFILTTCTRLRAAAGATAPIPVRKDAGCARMRN